MFISVLGISFVDASEDKSVLSNTNRLIMGDTRSLNYGIKEISDYLLYNIFSTMSDHENIQFILQIKQLQDININKLIVCNKGAFMTLSFMQKYQFSQSEIDRSLNFKERSLKRGLKIKSDLMPKIMQTSWEAE